MASAAPTSRKRRILIVEDDTLVSLGLRAELEKLGHEVVGEAAGCEDAVNMFQKSQPDVVLMDIRLDEKDGIDVAGQLLKIRKLVEKAKGIFMRRLNLDEAEAHKRLQQESQKRRIGMADLARKIIESEDILGG